jgi:NADPH:quinone reductase-like Zn-dependent oxidoreductase
MSSAKQTAAVITANGSVELKQVDMPKPGANEVLVKVAAAALNHIDCTISLLCLLLPLLKLSAGFTPGRAANVGKISGCDFAGVVVELGPGSEAFRKVGDRVASLSVACA